MGPNKLSSSDIDPELSNSMDDPFNIAGQQSSSEIQEISRADWLSTVMNQPEPSSLPRNLNKSF